MKLNRRQFLSGAAASGAALALPEMILGKTASKGSNGLRVALVGAGGQGRELLKSTVRIPGVRFSALCDIWPYHQKYGSNILKKYGQEPVVYTEVEEMLAKEGPSLDAVIIATPDWMHAPHSLACLRAGLHVYCEKEMSNTADGARSMVRAARVSKKLLQIGHQRRSNPRYLLARHMIEKEGILGRPTHVQGQWNRESLLDYGWPKDYVMPQAELTRWGYDSMPRFRNWRRYKTFSGGPMADLGSHQVDIFLWFLKTRPVSVQATGGLDYYKESEWYDTLLTLWDFMPESGPVRGFYQVANTTSHGGFFETFMGDEGSLVISEDTRKGFMFRESRAARKDWEDSAQKVEAMDRQAMELKIGETRKAGKGQEKTLEADYDPAKPVHQYHLENFFEAVRSGGKTKLNNPASEAFETCVAVLKANEALEKGCKVEFKPEDFVV